MYPTPQHQDRVQGKGQEQGLACGRLQTQPRQFPLRRPTPEGAHGLKHRRRRLAMPPRPALPHRHRSHQLRPCSTCRRRRRTLKRHPHPHSVHTRRRCRKLVDQHQPPFRSHRSQPLLPPPPCALHPPPPILHHSPEHPSASLFRQLQVRHHHHQQQPLLATPSAPPTGPLRSARPCTTPSGAPPCCSAQERKGTWHVARAMWHVAAAAWCRPTAGRGWQANATAGARRPAAPRVPDPRSPAPYPRTLRCVRCLTGCGGYLGRMRSARGRRWGSSRRWWVGGETGCRMGCCHATWEQQY